MGYGTGPSSAPANINDEALSNKIAEILREFSLLGKSTAVAK